MSATKRATAPKTSASFTSWKLRLLKAASADPRIPATYFRFLVRVVEALNQETRIAMIGDHVIADEVPGFKQQSTCNRARRALAELGYLSYEAGKGNKVTRYRISDEPVPAIMVAIDRARERRTAEREARQQAFRDQTNPAPVQGTASLRPCKSHPPKPAPVQGVHLQSTPSPKGYRQQDATQDAHEPLPASAPVPARAMLGKLPGMELPQSASGEFMCIDCGAETRTMARHGLEPYFPFCADCIESNELPDVKQIPPPPPRDDNELIAANDHGADYKRVRDGS